MEAAVAMGVGQVRVVENGLFFFVVVCGMRRVRGTSGTEGKEVLVEEEV